jgi:alkylresorcinol/alkylpyrone synthase
MVFVQSTGTAFPDNFIDQSFIKEFAKELFHGSNLDVDRLLPVFENAKISKRPILKEVDWYRKEKTFKEINEEFLIQALKLSSLACENALKNAKLSVEDIDGLVVVSSSGFVTPSLDARLIDVMGFRETCIRLPITGMGCAGGVVGLNRAKDLALMNPDLNILFVAVETNSLTFRPKDKRKSNLIALSLFSDGAAACILSTRPKNKTIRLKSGFSYKWKNSLDVMGWDVETDGLQVVFDKSIPVLIQEKFHDVFELFLQKTKLEKNDIIHYLFHPGGKKVLEAFSKCLDIDNSFFKYSYTILENYGNLSSPTVLVVLDRFLEQGKFGDDEVGILSAMGPGFSSEFLNFTTISKL